METDLRRSDKFEELRRRAEALLKEEPKLPSEEKPDILELIHELKVHQTELEIQNAELRQAQLELSDLHREFENLYEFAPCGYLTLNANGIITHANLTAVNLLGVARRRLLGSGLTRFIAPGWENAFFNIRNKAVDTGEKQIIRMPLKKEAGSPVWVRADIEADRYETGAILQWRIALVDITERKQAEAFKESEEQFRAMFESTDDVIFLKNKDMRFVKVNPAMEALFEKPASRLIGKTSAELFGVESAEINQKDDARVLAGETLEKDDYQLVKGVMRCFHLKKTPLHDADGEIIGICGISRDITHRKRAVAALTESEERYRRLFAAVSDAIVVFDAETQRIVDVNESAIHLYGYTAEEFFQLERRDLVVRPEASADRPFSGEIQDSSIHYHKKKDGTVFPAEISEGVFRSGNRPMLCEIIRDLGKRLEMEDGLRLSEARMKALFELSRMTDAPVKELADFVLDEIVLLTKSEIGFLGFVNLDENLMICHAWSKKAMEKCHVEDDTLVFPLDKAGLWAEAIREKKTLIVNDYHVPHPGGKGLPEGHVPLDRLIGVPVLAEDRVSLIAVAGNKATDYDESDVRHVSLLAQGLQQSITSKVAREEIQKSEARFKRAVDGANDGIWEWYDISGDKGWVSDRFYEICGYEPGSTALTWATFKGMVHPDDAGVFQRALDVRFEVGKHYEAEFRIKTASGPYKWISIRGKAREDEAGRVKSVAGSLQDIDDRKRAEDEARRREQYLTGLNNAVQALLLSEDEVPFQEFIDQIGAASNADRVYFFANHIGPNGDQGMRLRAEWVAEEIVSDIEPSLAKSLSNDERLSRWKDMLSWGNVISGLASGFPETERRILEARGILAVLIIPIVVEDAFFGFIGFDSLRSPKNWDPVLQTYLRIAAYDLTQAIKRSRSEQRVRESLREKEVLLREIHHRVKNNMQVIVSLLRMHSRKTHDPRFLGVFNDCRDRIEAMSLIHEALYQSKDLARIDFDGYLQNLCGNLGRAYDALGKGIAVRVDCCDIAMNMDQSIAVGMVIAELISNAFKHAFPLGKGGKVSVGLTHLGGEEVELIVADDGKGLPPEIDIRNPPSLGLRLVAGAVIRELGGSIHSETKGGARFIIRFTCKNG